MNMMRATLPVWVVTVLAMPRDCHKDDFTADRPFESVQGKNRLRYGD